MSIKITQQDRKRVKSTALVFFVIFIVSALLATLFICLTPRANQIKRLSKDEEYIEEIMAGFDEKTYYLSSKNWIYGLDTATDEVISENNVTAEIKEMLERKGEKNVDRCTFDQWQYHTLKTESENFYVVNDGNGNLFKYKENQNGQLELTEDYFILGANGETVQKRDCGASDNQGNDFYMFVEEGGFCYVLKYDLQNLSAGEQNRKFLWDIGTGADSGYNKVEALAIGAGIIGFYVQDDYILMCKKDGGIIRLSTEFVDSDDISDFFAKAEQESVKDPEIEAKWQAEYDKVYKEYLVADLIERRASRIADGKEFTVTEEQIRSATVEQILQYYKDNDYKDRTINNQKNSAAESAKTSADAKYPMTSSWQQKYDKDEMHLQVKSEYLDKAKYQVLYAGESTIYGMVYSKKNRALYYANASDGYLYVATASDLFKAETNTAISLVSTKIESVHCKKGQTFSNFGNGMNYNEHANTLYLKFANEKTVSIVDINDMQNYQVLYTFEGNFDMVNLVGDSKNTVTHCLRQITKVNLKGIDSPERVACTYNPARFETKTLTKVVFIAFIAIAVITGIFALYFAVASKSEKSLLKIKFIAKDSKKNKFVYLALVPFIAMLITFCYYEAVGAISMSFFSYTKESPAWIWNNFANYIKIFNEPNILRSVFNMLFFLVFDLILSIVPPVIFAILLILIRNKVTSNWIRALMFIPGIIPSIATMLIWRQGIYGDTGILNQMIMSMGGEKVQWFLNESISRWSLILMGFPFIGGYLIFYGGMINIPKEYHEAGRLEGLGTIKRFLSIDIPLIMPQIKYIFITTFIGSVQNFARTHVLRSKAVSTPVQSMYEYMTAGNYGMSSAYATLIFIFLFAAIATNFKMQKKDAMGADL
ncbi:MAG: sugar ABC transporter permease [Clostridia bacterium]|nr:sugar ABC transporter permease [Clostridia bacterium]